MSELSALAGSLFVLAVVLYGLRYMLFGPRQSRRKPGARRSAIGLLVQLGVFAFVVGYWRSRRSTEGAPTNRPPRNLSEWP